MTVAINARVSTDEQHVEQQRDLLIKFCKEKGWQYRSFLDEAMSGSISDRPGWQELLKEVERGAMTRSWSSRLIGSRAAASTRFGSTSG